MILDMWKPNLLLYNSANENFDATFPHTIIMNHDGGDKLDSTLDIQIHLQNWHHLVRIWWPKLIPGHITAFRSTFHTKINLSGFQVISYPDQVLIKDNGEWQLVSTDSSRNIIQYECCPEQYIDITVTITLRRRTLFSIFITWSFILIARWFIRGFSVAKIHCW